MPEGAVGLHEDVEDLEHDGAANGVVARPRALRHGVKVAVDEQGVLLGAPLARLHLGDDVLDVPVRENRKACVFYEI